MNDLMTKSFLSYVELKKQAQLDRDAESENYIDVELGYGNPGHIHEDNNLCQFFQEVEVIKADMEEISNLLIDLQGLNEESKITHSAKILRGIRDRMDSNMVSILRKGKVVKARLESLTNPIRPTERLEWSLQKAVLLIEPEFQLLMD